MPDVKEQKLKRSIYEISDTLNFLENLNKINEEAKSPAPIVRILTSPNQHQLLHAWPRKQPRLRKPGCRFAPGQKRARQPQEPRPNLTKIQDFS